MAWRCTSFLAGALSVLHRDLHQPLGWREAQSGRRSSEERVDPLDRLAAAAHLDERAGDAAHHAIQKRISRDRDRDPVAGAAHPDLAHVADGVATGSRAPAECPEVVPAGEPVSGGLHGGYVEGVAQAPGVLTLIGAPGKRLADAVRVEARPRRVAGIETLTDDFGAADRDVRGKAGIQGAGQLRDREVALEAEIYHLAERMHAGVGPPGRGQHRRLPGQRL